MIIFMMIVMFNMLVAIAGETYTNFTANQEAVANAIFADMLYELEIQLYILNRNKKDWGYIVYAEEVEPPADPTSEELLEQLTKRQEIELVEVQASLDQQKDELNMIKQLQ
jgi:hypothetical protein